MSKSKIEWTDASWNPVLGCRKVSEGCRNCYAMSVAWRMQHNPNPKVSDAYDGLAKMTGHGPEWTGKARFIPERLDQPLRWKRPRRIFVNSMSDLFHEDITCDQIAAVFGVMLNTPRHIFQVLTKRPARMLGWLRDAECMARATSLPARRLCLTPSLSDLIGQALRTSALEHGVPERRLERWCGVWPIDNVHLGVSIESAARKDRIDILRQCPAAVRWLSLEPLLGSLGDLDLTGIDWVVVGGESGPRARPMHPAWAREIRDQCYAQGVPFFFKQWGRWAPSGVVMGDEGSRLIGCDGAIKALAQAISARDVIMSPVGKRRAGRMLDGSTWDEMPGGLPMGRSA